MIVGPEIGGRLTVRLDPDERRALAKRATGRAIQPAELATAWLKNCLRQESERNAP